MVYVDEANLPFGRMKMSHMLSDDTHELLAMADRIGVSRRWLQKAGTPAEHMDICAEKRRLAVALGAKPVTTKYLAHLIRMRRVLAGRAADDFRLET